MATTHQCTKVMGSFKSAFRVLVTGWAATEEKWRGWHRCHNTLPQTRVERPRQRFIDLRNYMRIIRKLVTYKAVHKRHIT